jgi:hypothetical protein
VLVAVTNITHNRNALAVRDCLIPLRHFSCTSGTTSVAGFTHVTMFPISYKIFNLWLLNILASRSKLLKYCNVLEYLTSLRHAFTLLITSEHQIWRARLLKTPFGLLLRFIYDFTSRHYSLFYNVLWPSDVVSRSGPDSSALVLWSPLIWSSLICVGLSLDLLLLSICWSAFCDLLV